MDHVALSFEKHFRVFTTGEIHLFLPILDQFKQCSFCSEADPKGSDCFDKFVDMQECMRERPELYADDSTEDAMAEATEEIEAEQIAKNKS